MNRWPALVTLLGCALLPTTASSQDVVSYRVQGRFDDVRDDLRSAIEARGLVVDHHSKVGAMLERTGADVGSARKVFADAQSFQFCSAVVSRRMMEADPATVVLCPFSIAVHATAAQPGEVVVSYRRAQLPGAGAAAQAALREVDALLDGIAREAAGQR